MDYFRKLKVYSRVSVQEPRSKGQQIIQLRWIDTDKGRDGVANIRSRLVAKDFKFLGGTRFDLFAATPPLETFKLLISHLASSHSTAEDVCLLYVDVRRAYFHAPVRSDTYIQIPAEDWQPGDETKVGKLNVSLYGTREAASNWQEETINFMTEKGFIKGQATTCAFRHEEKGLKAMIHGDDYVVVGRRKHLQWFQEQISTRYEVKVEWLGPHSGMNRSVQILNRTVRWTDDGV
eukprot:4773839-Karenia_brevis.AAC.1